MHEKPRDLPVEAPLPPELCPYLVLETESAQAPEGSRFQGWWVLAWQSRLPVLQIEKGRSHPVGRCMTLQGDGRRLPVIKALEGAGLFITTERHWLTEAARLSVPTIWVADGRPDCNALTGGDELVPGSGLPPESALFEPGLFRAVFSHTAYRRELPLRRLFEAVEDLMPGLLHEDLSESSACRERMLPHLQGRIADIGHGGCKIVPQATGVDFFQFDESDWIGDARDLWFFQDQQFDTVYSSHCLEDLWHPHQALEEWTRILKVGGRLCLYLPLKDFYPNVGTPGANPGHKDDYEPRHVEAFLEALGHMDLLVSARRESEDSFEIIAEKKRGRSFLVQREEREAPLVSVLVPGPVTGEPREDARALEACIESAHLSLQGVAHEILVLDRSAAEGDGRAGLRDLAARHPEILIVEDRSPATWPRRLTRLHRRAAGTWTCVLDGQALVLGDGLRQLLDQAEQAGASAAVPAVFDQAGHSLDPEAPPCVLFRSNEELFADSEDTPFHTALYLRRCLDRIHTEGGRPLHVETATILHEGLRARPWHTIKLSELAFDRSLLARPEKPFWQSENILLALFRTLGDCILATPILEALASRDPGCRVTVLTEERYAWLFENHPLVADLIVVPTLEDEDFVIHEDAALLRLLRTPQGGTFDRLLFDSDRLDQVTYHKTGLSLQSFYAHLAGVPEAGELRPRVFLADETKNQARALLQALGIQGSYATLHRKAGWSNKDVGDELAAGIAEKLHREHGLPVVQIGGPGESIDSPHVIDLSGRLDAASSAALIAGATLHVGPDSGPLHLASCYDVPTLGLYAGSGIRVAPPLAWNSVALQSHSSCAVSCGVETCKERRPCTTDLEIGQTEAHLQSLLAGTNLLSEFVGKNPALYLSSPQGDRWIDPAAIPDSQGISRFTQRQACDSGSSLQGRSTPLQAIRLMLPGADELAQAWVQELQTLDAHSRAGRPTRPGEPIDNALRITLDSLTPWTAVEAERSLATRARRKGDLQRMILWLLEALKRCERIATGQEGRKRAAWRILADELHFDLCSALKGDDEKFAHLLFLLQRYESVFGDRAPVFGPLALLAEEGGHPIRDDEERALGAYLEQALAQPDPWTDPQLLLFALALSQIGREESAIERLEQRLLSIPEDRVEQRAPLAVRLGFLLARQVDELDRARDYLAESAQGLGDDGQRDQVESLLGRIDGLLGKEDGFRDPHLLQPHDSASRATSLTTGTLRVRQFANIDDLARELSLEKPGRLLEPDLDIPENECELGGRKRRDAEVLCTLAANLRGDVLDLGTSHGRSAFKFATNAAPGEKVYTVNALPEQIHTDETHITHRLDEDTIGSYYRDRGVDNVEQIYANTLDWCPPDEIRDLALAFVDANHDGAAVYSDSLMAWDRIRPGGYVIWHDFSPSKRERFPWIDSVMQGIEAFMHARKIEGEILHLEGSWIGLLRKTAATPSPIARLEHI